MYRHFFCKQVKEKEITVICTFDHPQELVIQIYV